MAFSHAMKTALVRLHDVGPKSLPWKHTCSLTTQDALISRGLVERTPEKPHFAQITTKGRLIVAEITRGVAL